MSSQQDEGELDDVAKQLLTVLMKPELGKRLLPHLLEMIEAEDVQRRIAASCAICLIAEDDDELLASAVRRLVDRLDEDSPIAVRHTLDYIAARNPRKVDEVLVDLGDEAEVRARESMYRTGGGFGRNDYALGNRSDPAHQSGRGRVAGGSSDDPRQAYTDEEPSGTGGGEASGRRERDGDRTAGDEDDSGKRERTDDATGLTRGRLLHIADRLSTIVADSRFEDLEVRSDRDRRRYADVYRTVGVVGGEERAIALLLFRLPDDRPEPFLEEFDSAMGYWAEVDDHPAVLSVYDWGTTPHPWAAVEYADLVLEDRGRLDPGAAVRNGAGLAAGLAAIHRQGVVHAAVDPKNVVYYGDALTPDADRQPLLANVSLTSVYRHYVEPATVLDPRYAAPEYYDGTFGEIDHTTDVYGLGTVLYRLCTGSHPYTGTVDAVREQVLSEPVPPPSEAVDAIPEELDQIVRKATARRKLRRYETVNHLERELRALGGTDAG